ncbi:ABC transporter ATP-binding protein [Marinoscillum sp.]|uniref:ABC transporter ATP-binding protein n=1 Tax=Marinoscillum sp. TaxID=2024838 RepID=UPI003BAA6A50
MRLLWRILQYARPVGGILPLYLLLVLGATVFSVINLSALIPLMQVLFDQIEPGVVSASSSSWSVDYLKSLFYQQMVRLIEDGGRLQALYFICGVVGVSVVLANLFRYSSQLILAKVRVRVIRNLRSSAFNQVLRFDLGYFHQQHKGDFISRLTVDVQDVEQSVVSAMKALIKEPFLLFGYLLALFSISPELTVYTLILIPMAGFGVSLVARRIRKWSRMSQESVGQLGGVLDETFSGMRIIKALNAQEWVSHRFGKSLDSYARETYQIATKSNLSSPISEITGVLVLVVTLILGGRMVLVEQTMNASTFIGFLVIFSQLLNPAKAISVASSQINKGLASAKRIFEVLDQPVESDASETKQPVFDHQVQFDNVSFSYREKKVLDQLSFHLQKGEILGLVGPSGAGKSTIADLLCAFYRPTSGSILVDGSDLTDIDIHLWRGKTSFVSQESVLFDESIRENILFGMNQVSDDELQKAVIAARVDEFAAKLEHGLDTRVGTNGSRLSGGQKQRIAIARAILRNPELLILDEATSSLDAESEHHVQEAMMNVMNGRTTLLIAHKMSTIQHADRILVLNNGGLVELGTHAELVQADGLYSKMTRLQSF